jgi:hypothetical protein
MEIAKTILNQLGGNKFIATTGSKNFVADKNALSMHLTKNKAGAKYLRIELNSSDTYTMTFSKLVKNSLFIVSETAGVYDDMLQSIFTKVTGLNTSLGTMRG